MAFISNVVNRGGCLVSSVITVVSSDEKAQAATILFLCLTT